MNFFQDDILRLLCSYIVTCTKSERERGGGGGGGREREREREREGGKCFSCMKKSARKSANFLLTSLAPAQDSNIKQKRKRNKDPNIAQRLHGTSPTPVVLLIFSPDYTANLLHWLFFPKFSPLPLLSELGSVTGGVTKIRCDFFCSETTHVILYRTSLKCYWWSVIERRGSIIS